MTSSPSDATTVIRPLSGVDIDSPRSIASFVALGTISVLSFIVQPALIQGFVTHLGLAESRAVGLAGSEMAGVALATILFALVAGRLSWRMLTAVSIVVAVIGNALSALWLHGENLDAARFIAGAGQGALIGLSFSFIGLTHRTDRNLGLYLVSLLTYSALGLWQGPAIFDAIGIDGVFWVWAGVTLLSLGLLPFLPHSAEERLAPSPFARQMPVGTVVVAMGGVLAYNMAQGIAWAILFLVGVNAGIAEQSVANALFISGIAAVVGALLAVVTAGKPHRTVPILIGIIVGAGCIAVLRGVPSALMFTAGVCGFNFLWNYAVPFILGAVGDMDTRGRLMPIAVSLQMIGLGLGPIVSEPIIAQSGLDAAEVLCILCFGASLVLLLPPLLAHRKALAQG